MYILADGRTITFHGAAEATFTFTPSSIKANLARMPYSDT